MAASPIHVFFDNSNMWGGAQAMRHKIESSVCWVALRIYYKNLFKLIENGRHATSRYLGGSVPAECEGLWEHARKAGYSTALLQKVVKDNGNLGEQAVDEILHLKIAMALLTTKPPQTLVLATGDGRMSAFGTSFSIMASIALEHGWHVEVCAFSPVLNSCYSRMAKKWATQMTIRRLDSHYHQVTFVQPGQYYRTDGAGSRIYFDTPKRVVSPLVLT